MTLKILMVGSQNKIHALRPLSLLLDQGCDVLYLDGKNPYPKGRPGFHYARYPYSGRCIYRRVGPFLGKIIANLTFIPYLRWLGKAFKPDIVHVHWVDCHANYCIKAGLKPLVLSVWGSDINNCFNQGSDPYHSRLVGQALASCDVVIIDSPEMKTKCEILASKSIRTEMLHLGVDTGKFKPGSLEVRNRWRTQLSIPEIAKIFVSIRAVSFLYQHDLILEAFSRVVKGSKIPVYLIFKDYNSDKDYYLQLRKQAVELGVEEQIRWLGKIPNEGLPEIYLLADAIVNFPKQDTFPVTFLEAAACETPVITCRLPGYLDTFAERYFSMVKENTVEDLASAIHFELENGTNRSGLTDLRREVIERFDQSVYLHNLLSVYDSVRLTGIN